MFAFNYKVQLGHDFRVVILVGSLAFGTAAAQGQPLQTLDSSQTLPKGSPLTIEPNQLHAPVQPSVQKDPCSYYYDTAYLFKDTLGAGGTYTIEDPHVATGDYHSLAELSVQSRDQNQTIEVGWTVDPALNHDSYAHLFVYYWVDHAPKGYNTSAFQRNPKAVIKPGDPMAAEWAPRQFQIKYNNQRWEIFVGNTFLGYYPASLWKNFTKIGLTSWFGEVCSTKTTNPDTFMGNGGLSDKINAATITDMFYIDSQKRAVRAQPSFKTTLPKWYSYKFDGITYRYGGPGVPVITSVSQILAQGIQTITIKGTGFGTLEPYNGDSPYIWIRNETRGWNAGWTGNSPIDYVTLGVSSWTDNQIILSGFTGSYGSSGWVHMNNDLITVSLWNPQRGRGPGQCRAVVGKPNNLC